MSEDYELRIGEPGKEISIERKGIYAPI